MLQVEQQRPRTMILEQAQYVTPDISGSAVQICPRWQDVRHSQALRTLTGLRPYVGYSGLEFAPEDGSSMYCKDLRGLAIRIPRCTELSVVSLHQADVAVLWALSDPDLVLPINADQRGRNKQSYKMKNTGSSRLIVLLVSRTPSGDQTHAGQFEFRNRGALRNPSGVRGVEKGRRRGPQTMLPDVNSAAQNKLSFKTPKWTCIGSL